MFRSNSATGKSNAFAITCKVREKLGAALGHDVSHMRSGIRVGGQPAQELRSNLQARGLLIRLGQVFGAGGVEQNLLLRPCGRRVKASLCQIDKLLFADFVQQGHRGSRLSLWHYQLLYIADHPLHSECREAKMEIPVNGERS
jgi:hypothetical protein